MCQLSVDYSHLIIYIICMVSEVRQKFSLKLKKIREKRKLSQENLALLCNIDRTHIGRIERLERNPSLDILSKIAIGLNISLSELLDFDELS